MSHEKWLVSFLSLTVIIILSLTGALTWSLGWSNLAVATLLFFICYPLAWLAWKAHQFWCLCIMQLTTFTQVLREGEQSLRFKKQNKHNLLLELQKEISSLAHNNSDKNDKNQRVETLLRNILDAWSVPVCLFDHQLQLSYRNNAMNELLQQPMLIGARAKDLGFHVDENNFSHPLYDDKWQCQSIRYVQQGKDNWLFTAIDISQLLNQNQSTTQNNLIRVLGHELRNSLTPMSSMADTLLCSEVLNEAQTRKVLNRIRQRSDRLMTFIEQYSQLSQLPPAQAEWFDFSEILVEAKAMINENCKVQYSVSNGQVIDITDNGPGFANLDNVLTPFYTTKTHGSGIGLSLCAEITRNHQGQLSVSNLSHGGAKISMTWPTST